jgi:hypothetical protein
MNLDRSPVVADRVALKVVADRGVHRNARCKEVQADLADEQQAAVQDPMGQEMDLLVQIPKEWSITQWSSTRTRTEN